MLIKKKICEPMIVTIPDDAAFFSILNPAEKATEKVVMENYINFYCYKDSGTDISFFRFEDFLKRGNIEGMDSCFVPLGMLQRGQSGIDILVEVLMGEYVISVPIMKEYIKFYGSSAEGTHVVFVYGADTFQKTFLCKDFAGHAFVEFTVSFEEMQNSLLNYNICCPKEQNNLNAFRINEKVSPDIEYAKVYSEFHKLCQDFSSRRAGYGMGAIDLYLREVRGYPQNTELAGSWYVLANYLREATKLMNYRYRILEKEIPKTREGLTEGEKILRKLEQDTDMLFFKIARMKRKRIIVDSDIADSLTGTVEICKEDFRRVADYFCRIVC